ncbi:MULTISPECIES: glycerate kinase [unclassified Paenibacillus]|uniref:glycerate kinase family protein n=1 Tax=unclassified Paenibacillus TaxID=185978 RepID=UPI001050342A|nr:MULTISPECIES: glycerate kinase [unclassified Paenibacillus]NIK72188.1 glycerate kinase [Paenibacillus sp. BK720]TCM88644.1 glycerate kinase [Paenibacillus sp. BK033]
MKIVVAPDSFKGSLSAASSAEAIAQGVRRCVPDAQIIKLPIADGGEGTLDSLLTAAGGERVNVSVAGPLERPVEASYGLLGQTAVIEMAEASGLCLLKEEERNPSLTTTYGTGELIRHALDRGCRRFLLTVGGSATNDGGTGMLQALGMRLLDRLGNPVPAGGGNLVDIVTIDDSSWDPRIAESSFVIATDVQNPLIGEQGASRVFGPQKGATTTIVNQLEHGMTAWADRIQEKTGIRLHDRPGAGAAGGLCGAYLAFFPASIRRGIDVVLEHVRLEEHLKEADLVITGEGRIDHQTASGKAPMGVAQLARKHGIPAIALAGSVGTGIEALYAEGIHSVHSIISSPMTLKEAMEYAPVLLEQAAEQVIRTFLAGRVRIL